jgi:putative tricarboxylic transport membrane protein
MLESLGPGFAAALTLANLGWCLAGAFIGTLIGVLPGVGPVAAIAMLLPAMHALDATSALILLAAVYYGAQYGGTTAASLRAAEEMSTPARPRHAPSGGAGAHAASEGDDADARAARSGAALAVASLGSFAAGCLATLVIALAATPLLELAADLDPGELFAMMAFVLVFSIVLAPGSLVKAGGMILVGLLLGQLDHDVATGAVRLAVTLPPASHGTIFIGLAMGVFVFGAILVRLAPRVAPTPPADDPTPAASSVPLARLRPTREALRPIGPPVLRGTLLGAILGVLPGRGPRLAAVLSQRLERILGHRRPPGDAAPVFAAIGPEAAHHAGAQSSLVPMLILGTPSNAVTAMIAGVLALKGLGPRLATADPILPWAVIASMWIGNALLLVLNLPLVGLWKRLLSVPYGILFPALVVVSCVGLYAMAGNPVDVWVGGFFGFVGYVLIRLGCEPAPLLLAFVLGPMMEARMREALALSHGDWSVFVTRPISAALLFACAAILLSVWLPSIRKLRERTFRERG